MAWKNYYTVKCPTCQSKSYRDGKTSGRFQLFKCTNQDCRRRFDERDFPKKLALTPDGMRPVDPTERF